jgi:uracil-DNA glycosylase family 4
MFTGDESGRWLFRALYRAGFASRAESLRRDDGLVLTDCYITAALRCAPPQNRPLPVEMMRCSSYLREELRLLPGVRVVVGLGKIGFESALKAYRAARRILLPSMPRFAHGSLCDIDGLTFLACYHPSQQNTFTGRLTEEMLDAVFQMVRERLRENPRGRKGRQRERRMRKVVPPPGVLDFTKSFPRW